MWWIIGIVVYILSFFAIWLFIIQEAKDGGDKHPVGDCIHQWRTGSKTLSRRNQKKSR